MNDEDYMEAELARMEAEFERGCWNALMITEAQ